MGGERNTGIYILVGRLPAYMRECHLFGPADYSVGVRAVMMCLCSWVFAHPQSRHLYNSICLAAKSGRSPAKTLAKRQGERERDLHCGSPNQYRSSIYTSSPQTTLIHLPRFITELRSVKVSILTTAENVKVQYFNCSRQ